MPTDRRWSDADRELVVDAISSNGTCGDCEDCTDERAAAVMDALTAAGWRPPPTTLFDQIDATIAALKARDERGRR